MKLRILWPVLLLVHNSITVTLCSTKCLTKTSTNCSEFRIVQHELSVESVDGNKMLGSYVTTCTAARLDGVQDEPNDVSDGRGPAELGEEDDGDAGSVRAQEQRILAHRDCCE